MAPCSNSSPEPRDGNHHRALLPGGVQPAGHGRATIVQEHRPAAPEDRSWARITRTTARNPISAERIGRGRLTTWPHRGRTAGDTRQHERFLHRAAIGSDNDPDHTCGTSQRRRRLQNGCLRGGTATASARGRGHRETRLLTDNSRCPPGANEVCAYSTVDFRTFAVVPVYNHDAACSGAVSPAISPAHRTSGGSATPESPDRWNCIALLAVPAGASRPGR